MYWQKSRNLVYIIGGTLAIVGSKILIKEGYKVLRAKKIYNEIVARKILNTQTNKQLSVAIIGCGAVTQLGHLPVANELDEVNVSCLVDKDLNRAQSLAKQYNVPYSSDNYLDVVGKADMAIVALPHYLHAPVSIDLLQHGLHVLVEKPMALSSVECDQMIQAAEASKRIIGVGLFRRFFTHIQMVKQIIDAGLLGEIVSFDFREGWPYGWPVASDFFFSKKRSGGGVLIDTGGHVLDLLLWWLGDYETVEYFDDNFGGVEADCTIKLTMKNGSVGTVDLSRTRKLGSSYSIQGSLGTLKVNGVLPQNGIRLQINSSNISLVGTGLRDSRSPNWAIDGIYCQLKDFAQAVTNQHAPLVSGIEARRSVQLIEACYANQASLDQPWDIPLLINGKPLG